MSYSYEQIGALCVTFKCTANVQVGHVCRMYTNECVSTANADNDFDGVTVSKRDQNVAVAVRGFVTVPYTGNAPSVGYKHLLANGQGGVQVADEGKTYLIVNVDTGSKTVTFLM